MIKYLIYYPEKDVYFAEKGGAKWEKNIENASKYKTEENAKIDNILLEF